MRKIHSHPVALAQCERFFSDAQWDCARGGRGHGGLGAHGDGKRRRDAGGHCRESAAREYGAEVLVSAVEDDAHNYTRFALLLPEAKAEKVEGADATALVLTVANRPGALFRSLEPFAANDVDLMSLVSRPLVGEPWHYRFFLEVAAAEDDARM